MLLSVKEVGFTWVSFDIPKDMLLTHRPVIKSSIQEGWNGERGFIVEIELIENSLTLEQSSQYLNVFENAFETEDPNGY